MIEQLGPWFHNLHLPDGTETCPDHAFGDFPRFKWEEIARVIPQDLRGARALDIGCNAGFYSIELARRGARVTAIDVDEHYLRQASWACEQFGLADRIELRRQTVYDLGRGNEQWDVVLFMGVFYHLRYPLLGLDAVSRCVGDLLVFQTLTAPERRVRPTPYDTSIGDRQRLLEPGWPTLAFVEHRLAGDPTNWWVADHACVEALLRSAGLRIEGRPGEETWLCRPDRGGPSSHWTWNEPEFRAALGRNGGGSP